MRCQPVFLPAFLTACRLLGWLLGLLLATEARAAPAPPGWIPDEALGSLMLRTVVQAPGGLLWAGTDDGVYRYDGTRLVPLNTLRRGGPALPAVPCNQLLPLPDGQLWIGTEAGLYRLLPGGQLELLPLPVPASSNRLVDALALAADGRVWVSQNLAGTRAYSAGGGRPVGPLLGANLTVTESWAAPDGTLWLANDDGTRQLSAGGQVQGAWRQPGGLSPVYDPAGHAWLLGQGAFYRAGAGGQLTPVISWPTETDDIWPGVLRSAGGPALLLPGQVRQFAWSAGRQPQPQLSFTVALPPWQTAHWRGRLQADQTGQWWAFDSGTRGCWHRAAAPSFIRALPGPGRHPYSVRALVRLPDGRLLVSTYGGLLTQAADSPLAPLRYWPQAVLQPGGNAPVLQGIVPRPLGPGGDWLAAGVYPLLRFSPGTGRFERLTAQGQSQANIGVNALVRDPGSNLVWAGTRLGLYGYDSRLQTFRPYAPPGTAPPLAGQVVEDVCPDGRGHLWLATPEGVERLTLATGQRRFYGPTAPLPHRAALDGARCLYLACDGRLWVGTRAHGLAVIDLAGRVRPALTLGQGLPNASVASILPGPAGTLWLGTYQGLVRYQPATGQLAVFTTAHGLASDECNARAAYVDPADSSLLVGGVAGLHRVWPGQVPAPAASRPRLLLTGLAQLEATAEASRPRYLLATDPLPALHLAPDAPLVDLHLALANAPGRARYAYRVRGWLAGQWLGLGTTPELRLQGLPPGHYQVEIRAESGQGVPAANVLRLPLTVTAAWWNRPSTWALAALAAVAAVYSWQRGRLRQLRREHDLRARLAADLHDEVGALLTRVTMQAELLREVDAAPAPHLTALVEDSRAAASTVRDIIWSVDAEADTLDALAARVQDHLDATARATARPLSFDDTGLPADLGRALPPTVRQHTYLIFREALTNALKYSPAGSSIAVVLACTDHLLTLSVASQAEATSATSRAGQGLRNMRQRATRLRATLHAAPLAAGWLVQLRVPL